MAGHFANRLLHSVQHVTSSLSVPLSIIIRSTKYHRKMGHHPFRLCCWRLNSCTSSPCDRPLSSCLIIRKWLSYHLQETTHSKSSYRLIRYHIRFVIREWPQSILRRVEHCP